MIRLAVIVCFLAGPAFALKCQNDSFKGISFSQCEVTLHQDDIRLFLRDDTGAMLGYFPTLREHLANQNLNLLFAMNAGMYRPDYSPAGHFVEEGQEIRHVMTRPGPGNFGLLPNGILCITENRVDVYETQAFLRRSPSCRFATQSGPMLVIDGTLHPKFTTTSKSKFIRNGVGTTSDGQKAFFVISNAPLTLHMFGRYFKDHLNLKSALYLDGNVSHLYAPVINRRDFGRKLGPMIGVVGPVKKNNNRARLK